MVSGRLSNNRDTRYLVVIRQLICARKDDYLWLLKNSYVQLTRGVDASAIHAGCVNRDDNIARRIETDDPAIAAHLY